MSRIAHLSDLHFGRDRPELLDPLVDLLNDAALDAVLVSGDLTQRARHGQFRDARAFLDRLQAPWFAVPGNHDTPLDNLFVRLLWPWGRYRRYIQRDLEPLQAGPDYLLAGLNTADPAAWQRGRLRDASIGQVRDHLCAAEADGKLGIVMMHHPPEHLEGDRKQPMKGAEKGLRRLSEMGADLVLCGHLHVWRALPARLADGILILQVGTGLSTRGRGEPNDFNILTIEGARLTIDRYGAGPGQQAFARLSTHRFDKQNGQWRAL